MRISLIFQKSISAKTGGFSASAMLVQPPTFTNPKMGLFTGWRGQFRICTCIYIYMYVYMFDSTVYNMYIYIVKLYIYICTVCTWIIINIYIAA